MSRHLERLARLLPRIRGRHDAVLSFNVQARVAKPPLSKSQFEILLRHLFDRLLNNEAFGEDAAQRVAQLAYAIVLPGILVALFLFPAYHGLPPNPIERPYWSQVADHLFYVTYSLVILGTAALFQWDLLFPDMLDVFVLCTLPIPLPRLLFARISALAIFLALILLGTTGLSDLFFPAVADLYCGFWKHFFAHTTAVTLSAVSSAVFFIAAQSLLACLPGRKLFNSFAPLLRIFAIVVLLTALFLFPLTAHFLPELLESPSTMVQWFPPFWFLGLYEVLLYGSSARPVFHELARFGLFATFAVAIIATITYPIAYLRRTRHHVEGTSIRKDSSLVISAIPTCLHHTVIRNPRSRALFHFVAQTLARLHRLHLYMAMYAGLGLALILSGLIVFQFDGGHLEVAFSSFGVRLAIPVLAFWIVAGLRTTLLSPVGRGGSWLFNVISGQPQFQDLCGAEIFVRTIAITLTLLAVGVLHLLSPRDLSGPTFVSCQIVVAVGLCLLLTDVFFMPVRSIPFTAAPFRSTRELPLTLVRYLVFFPALTLSVANFETWIEASTLHLLLTGVAIAAAHMALRKIRRLVLRWPAPIDDLLLTSLDLRGD